MYFLQRRLIERLSGRYDANYHCVSVLLHFGDDAVVEVGPHETLFEVAGGQRCLVDAESLNQQPSTLNSL